MTQKLGICPEVQPLMGQMERVARLEAIVERQTETVDRLISTIDDRLGELTRLAAQNDKAVGILIERDANHGVEIGRALARLDDLECWKLEAEKGSVRRDTLIGVAGGALALAGGWLIDLLGGGRNP